MLQHEAKYYKIKLFYFLFTQLQKELISKIIATKIKKIFHLSSLCIVLYYIRTIDMILVFRDTKNI